MTGVCDKTRHKSELLLPSQSCLLSNNYVFCISPKIGMHIGGSLLTVNGAAYLKT